MPRVSNLMAPLCRVSHWFYRTVLSFFCFIIALPFIVFRFATRKFTLESLIDLCLNKIPPVIGRPILSSAIAFEAPFTGSIFSDVKSFSVDEKEGTIKGVISIPDVPHLRNPFNSLHAAALANLGELVTGLCVVLWLDRNKQYRGIPSELKIKFVKKARGTVDGVCTLNMNDIAACIEKNPNGAGYEVSCEIKDQKGDVCAVCSVVWTLSKKEAKKKA
eukprot:GDKI01030865.1.p1 GENE.GDKI01030865.1~~GDKI01030865.1.p1  ORF type:complete len:218 (+),score=40.55 GDKI01030865.1:93-746(+)